jgi:hypothetical protein
MIKLKADDGTILELLDYVTHPTTAIKQEIYNVGACHVAFQVYNIEQAYIELSKKNINFLSAPILSSEGFTKVCFCMDPDSTRIELVEIL